MTAYPDVAAIYRDLAALVGQPIRPVRREAMATYSAVFRRALREVQSGH